MMFAWFDVSSWTSHTTFSASQKCIVAIILMLTHFVVALVSKAPLEPSLKSRKRDGTVLSVNFESNVG
jgi:hypothetical protein